MSCLMPGCSEGLQVEGMTQWDDSVGVIPASKVLPQTSSVFIIKHNSGGVPTGVWVVFQLKGAIKCFDFI